MIHRAQADLGIDPSGSYAIGDRWLDVQLGHNVGARGILVRTGYGATEERQPPDGTMADMVADNLIEAVNWILRDSRCLASASRPDSQ